MNTLTTKSQLTKELDLLITELDKVTSLAMEGFHHAPEGKKKPWGRLIDKSLDERLRLKALRGDEPLTDSD